MTVVLSNVRDVLIGQRNADGGWGYAAGKASRLEPTSWALLALARADGRPIDVDVLLKWKRQDGWLVDVPGAPINYAFNALAAIALRTHERGAGEARVVAAKLLDVRGLRFEQGREIRQDNSLQAWSWIETTFSWVEPTALCLLLTKMLKSGLPAAAAADRINIAERMLLDRACTAGGWNYGGSNVYGQELFPYVPTTALGLLALQDRRSNQVVDRALMWIRKEALTEPSAQAIALATIAMEVLGTDAKWLEQALADHLNKDAASTGVAGLAAGLYALSRSIHGKSAFAI